MSTDQITTLVVVAMAVAAPVLWAALGELVAEKAGIINPGIEGVMLTSALVTTITYRATGSLVTALVAAVVTGVACGLLFGFLFVTRGVNQIITGILFNLLALGATTTVFIADRDLARARVPVVRPLAVPFLADLPLLGPVLFRQNVFVYASVVAVAAVWFLMRRTWLGLSIRAAGEHPRAVEAAGLDVWRVRYVAVVVGSVLPAVGGAVLVLGIVGGFNAGMSSGQGLIALGIVVLARWNPWGVVAGSLLFGVAQALQFQAQNFPVLSGVPIELWLAMPYLVTVAAVMLTRSSEYPRAAATPYLPPRATSAHPHPRPGARPATAARRRRAALTHPSRRRSLVMHRKRSTWITAATAALVLPLAACGGGDAPESPGAAPAPGGDGETFRVAALLTGTENDGAISQGYVEGMRLAEEKHGVEIRTVGPVQSPDETMQQGAAFAQEGFDMVIIVHSGLADSVPKLAEQFPDTVFCAFYDEDEEALAAQPDNVCYFDPEHQYGSFMGGVAAGLATAPGTSAPWSAWTSRSRRARRRRSTSVRAACAPT